jgi:hypothetical protein
VPEGSASRKWFIPPTRASTSRMQAETHEPRIVEKVRS